jgi:hypothetical protein
VALTFPILAGAAVSGLPADRSATGSALFDMFRQIGGVVGVAVFVAILGTAPGLAELRAGWIFIAASALGAGATALLLPARPARAQPDASGRRSNTSASRGHMATALRASPVRAGGIGPGSTTG